MADVLGWDMDNRQGLSETHWRANNKASIRTATDGVAR
jgi:hypothetical protein